MAKLRKRSDGRRDATVEVSPAQVAKALQAISSSALDLSQWALGIRRVVLTLGPDVRMRMPDPSRQRPMSGVFIDYDCPPPPEEPCPPPDDTYGDTDLPLTVKLGRRRPK